MIGALPHRLNTNRSPGPTPGLRRYGVRESRLMCSTHAFQPRTCKRPSSATGRHCSAECIHSVCLAFAGVLHPMPAAAALFLPMTQAGSTQATNSATDLIRPVSDPTWVMAHEYSPVAFAWSVRLTQPGALQPHGAAPALRFMVVWPRTRGFHAPHPLSSTVTQPGARMWLDPMIWVTSGRFSAQLLTRSIRMAQPGSLHFVSLLATEWGCVMT